jgi:hypothetical protein
MAAPSDASWAHHYDWQATEPSSTFLSVKFAIHEPSRVAARFDDHATWSDARAYWIHSGIIDWTFPRVLVGSFSSSEARSSCEEAGVWEPAVADCPLMDLRSGGNSTVENTLAAGTYVLFSAAYGVTTARPSHDLRTEKPITVLAVHEGATRLVLAESGHDGDAYVGAWSEGTPALARVRPKNAVMQSIVVELNGTEYLSYVPMGSTPDGGSHWRLANDTRRLLTPSFGGPPGSLEVTIRARAAVNETPLLMVGLMMDPGFVNENGILDALGPGVFAADEWRHESPFPPG